MGETVGLSRRRFLAGLAASGLVAGAARALTVQQVSDVSADLASARFLCLIVLDGFRPDYLQLAAMPALQTLIQRGITYERAWVGQLESETPTGHATLSTGLFPQHHGLVGFEWRDPVSRREVLDGWEQGEDLGQVGRDLHAHAAASIPQTIKAADPSALVVTVSSEKVYAADAMSVETADYVLYHRIVENRLVPGTLPGQVPPATLLSAKTLARPLPLQHFTEWDYLSGELALTAFHELRPTALMVNLPGSDVYGHKFAAQEAGRIMATVVKGQDRAIGRIVEAYKAAGMFDQTLFVITADHAMVPNHHTVSPNDIAAAVRAAGAAHLFHTGGTAKYVYLRDQSLGLSATVAQNILRIPAVLATYSRLANGEYERSPGPIEPQLDAAYRYLLSTFSGTTAPDVVAAYRENTVGTTYPVAYGNHGGLSWGVQHIPLVLSGPGVRQGVRSTSPARLVDVAPTVLRLLALEQQSTDGVVLADALQHATAHEVTAQQALSAELRPYQAALMAQSSADVRDDRAHGVHSPPPPSAQP